MKSSPQLPLPLFASIHFSAGKLQAALPSLEFPLPLISMKVINVYLLQTGEMTEQS